MISGKGILITILTASSAAAILGTVLTQGKEGSLRRLVDKVKRFTGSRLSQGRKTETNEAIADGLATTGHGHAQV